MSQVKTYPTDFKEREKRSNLYDVFVALVKASNAATMIFQKHPTAKQKWEGFLFGVTTLEDGKKRYVYIVAPINDDSVGTHMIAACSSEVELCDGVAPPTAMFQATSCTLPGMPTAFHFPAVGGFINDPLFNAQQAIINAIIASGKFNQ